MKLSQKRAIWYANQKKHYERLMMLIKENNLCKKFNDFVKEYKENSKHNTNRCYWLFCKKEGLI